MNTWFNKKMPLTVLAALMIVLALTVALFSLKASYTIQRVVTPADKGGAPGDLPLSEERFRASPEPNRIDILLLGIRGENDPWGGLLTDAILLASIDKESGKTALISVPRDLYLYIPEAGKKEKINAAYAAGLSRGGIATGLKAAKEAVSQVCGVYVDHAVVVNFDAFRTFIDSLGGITIDRATPFVETKQWWCDEHEENCGVFSLPAGKSNLDGTTTLYYIRSRKSSDDFDRARRQQEVLLAVKEKLLSLGVLANPVKWFSLLDVIGNNVRTDAPVKIWRELAGYIQEGLLDTDSVSTFVFDTSKRGLLEANQLEDGTYILLPRDGDFVKMRQVCQSIL